MDDEELALFFAAKQENAELKAKVKNLENLKSMHEKQIGDCYVKNRRLELFISDIGRFPFFWARTYKKHIMRFIERYGLWKGNNDR